MSDRTVLVGYDGSTGAREAVALALPLARWWRAGIHLVTVHPPIAAPGAIRSAAHESRVAVTAAQGARLVGGSVKCRSSEIRAATTARGLHELATGGGAKCVVVGRARHRPRLTASVGRQVLHGCPVAVALPGHGLKPRVEIDDIVLAVDARLAELADHRPVNLRPPGHIGLQQQLDQLIDFAGQAAADPGRRIRLCALVEPSEESTGVPDRIQRATDYARERLDADIEVMIAAVGELSDRVDSRDLVVHVGDAFGAHGYLQPSPTDLHLLHENGLSLLMLPPTPPGAITGTAQGDGRRHMAGGGDVDDGPGVEDSHSSRAANRRSRRSVRSRRDQVEMASGRFAP
ncbi:MAG: universal stress protein [Pseudonocardiaceae bacterium]|jgi:nucleotide-binding universal stress UspA family protein|nr:universal stress protein [Pseudonocardiaceae bacterium]